MECPRTPPRVVPMPKTSLPMIVTVKEVPNLAMLYGWQIIVSLILQAIVLLVVVNISFSKNFFFFVVSQVHYRFIKNQVCFIKTNYLFLKNLYFHFSFIFIFFYISILFYLTFFFETDMDLDGVVFVNLAQEKYCGFSCWFPFVIAGIVGVMVAGFVGYELHKRSKGESTCLCNRDGNNKSENSFFSSGGYVAVDA